MNPSTTTTTTSATRPREVTPFQRLRRTSAAPRYRAPEHRPRLSGGTSPIDDPRRDLQMFELSPAARRPVGVGQWLGPLVPPIASDPSAGRAGRPRVSAPTVTPARAGSAPRRVAAPMHGRARVRLTRRAHALLLGLAVCAVALCSALTVAHDTTETAVPSVQVVARAGESVESVAQRTADGRDVHELAQSIRAVNGLSADEVLRGGDVLIVPGA